jgi:hypothetical protein
MDKGTVFSAKAPNGVEITAVVLRSYETLYSTINVCYSQNRLFEYEEIPNVDYLENVIGYIIGTRTTTDTRFGDTIIDYCVIPELDEKLSKIK